MKNVAQFKTCVKDFRGGQKFGPMGERGGEFRLKGGGNSDRGGGTRTGGGNINRNSDRKLHF